MTTAAELSENSHQGFEAAKRMLCLAAMQAKSNTASGMPVCLRRNGIGPRSSSKERDAETGLDFFGARYYSGAQGRFTGPDSPFADQAPYYPQSWNLYAYVRNNPLLFVDKTGRYITVADPRISEAYDYIGSNSWIFGDLADYFVESPIHNLRIEYTKLGNDPDLSPLRGVMVPEDVEWLSGVPGKFSGTIYINEEFKGNKTETRNILMEEFSHAFRAATDPKGYQNDSKTHNEKGEVIHHDKRPEEQRAKKQVKQMQDQIDASKEKDKEWRKVLRQQRIGEAQSPYEHREFCAKGGAAGCRN